MKQKSFLETWDIPNTQGCVPYPKYCRKSDGRGMGQYQGRVMYAYVAIYIRTFGPIPQGMVVRHKCDNPSCCNPRHLCIGTQQENCQDRERRFLRQRVPTWNLSYEDYKGEAYPYWLLETGRC